MKQQYFYNHDNTIFTTGYTGWCNIHGDIVYKTKYQQNEILTPSGNPQSLNLPSEFYNDWTIDEYKQYPYQLNDILIQPNEIVTAHVLNATMDKLYTNLEYLISRSVYYTNNIPSDYKGWFGCSLNIVNDSTLSQIYYTVGDEYEYHPPSKPCYQYYPCRYASLSCIRTDEDLYNYTLHKDDSVNNKYYFDSTTANPTGIGFGLLSGMYDPNYDITKTASTYSNPKTAFYDNIINIITIPTKTDNTISLFVTKTALLMRKFTKTDDIYKIENYYEDDSDILEIEVSEKSNITSVNGITFTNITAAELSDAGYLYVFDSFNKTLYQFDASYIINDDNAIKGLKLVNAIGGKNDFECDVMYKFTSPKFIRCSNKHIFIYDEEESTIFIFDEFLNYKSSVSNMGFKYNKPAGVMYRELHDEYVVVCEDATLQTYTGEFNLKSIVQLNDISEKCLTVAASTQDTNIYYLVTTSHVYEKTFSNNNTVGIFDFVKWSIVNDAFKWWRSTYIEWISVEDLWSGSYNFPMYTDTFNINGISVKSVDGVDEIWIYANNGRLIWLKNKIAFESLFTGEVDGNTNIVTQDNYIKYLKSQLKCNEQEYIQSFTYNKIIIKFIDNLQKIINALYCRPQYEYNSSGNLIYLKNEHITEDEKTAIITKERLKNVKIYDNDILSTTVINRVLTQLFEIEQHILDITKPHILNTKYNITNELTIEFEE